MYDIIVQYRQTNQTSIHKFGMESEQENDSSRFDIMYSDDTLIALGKKHNGINYCDLYKGNEYVVFIAGTVLARIHTGKSFFDASDIAAQKRSDELDYSAFKGNFTLFIYHRYSKVLEIFSDPIGLCPVYIGEQDSTVFLSSNLNELKAVNDSIDYTTVLEKLVFTYPITSQSFLRNFEFIEPGTYYRIHRSKIEKTRIFDLNGLLFRNEEKQFRNEDLAEIVNYNVRQSASLVDTPLITLTGGFDGRTIVSSMLRQNLSFHSFSFGRQGGENTQVPLKLAKDFDISYEPVYLDEDYEKNYPFLALKAIEQSDGLSKFERANYSYTTHRLSYLSPILISGLIGGELLGILFNKTDYFNENYFDWIYNGESTNIEGSLKDKGVSQFISKDQLKVFQDSLNERIQEHRDRISWLKQGKYGYLYYLYDLISLGFRRFYGGQIHQERYHYENIPPLFDIDILNYLFSTNFKERYKYSFTNKKIYKLFSRRPQSELIHHNFPGLADKKVDRGFPPKYLLNSAYYPLAFWLLSKRNRSKRVREFTSDRWSKLFYDYLLDKNISLNAFFNQEEIFRYMREYEPNNYNQEFNNLLSIAVWTSTNETYHP